MTLDNLIKYSGYLASALFILIGFIVSFEVISRYVFNAPTVWVNEISRFLQIWATYLALTYSFHKNDFIRITVIYDRLGKSGKKISKSTSKCIRKIDDSTCKDAEKGSKIISKIVEIDAKMFPKNRRLHM